MFGIAQTRTPATRSGRPDVHRPKTNIAPAPIPTSARKPPSPSEFIRDNAASGTRPKIGRREMQPTHHESADQYSDGRA